MTNDFAKRLSQRHPFQTILKSPHLADIDERLFQLRQSVLSVHRWLTEELEVDDITYATLNRYKNARREDNSLGDVRKAEVLKDVKYLSRVIKLGGATLDAGLAVRPSEAMRAIELRAQLLAQFPDATEERLKVAQHELKLAVDCVLTVVTEEQRLEIVRRISERLGEVPVTEARDA
jgi:hypothetical protein